MITCVKCHENKKIKSFPKVKNPKTCYMCHFRARKPKFCIDCKIEIGKHSSTKRCRACYYKSRIGKNTFTAEGLESMRKSKLGKNNPMWKGENVGYTSLHEWVRNRMPLPKVCSICKATKNIDLSNNGTYDRELKNWAWRCRSCHMKYDISTGVREFTLNDKVRLIKNKQ